MIALLANPWVLLGGTLLVSALIVGVQSERLRSSKASHETTKIEFANFRNEVEQRGSKIFKQSELASFNADMEYRKSLQQAKEKATQIALLIKENENLKRNRLSTDFVELFNRSVSPNTNREPAKEASKETKPGTNETNTGSRTVTEQLALDIINRNNERYKECKAIVEGLHKWINGVCSTNICED